MRLSGGALRNWAAAVSENRWRRLMEMSGGSDENTQPVARRLKTLRKDIGLVPQCQESIASAEASLSRTMMIY